MTHSVAVLGSTGSIGTQTLEVAESLGLHVSALVARTPSALLTEQAMRFPDAVVVVAGTSQPDLGDFSFVIGREALGGVDRVAEVAARANQIVMNGIVGAAGLRASLAALEAGNRVGLANKESLVAGGPLVRKALESGGGELIPVDSEHSALHQCLVGERSSDVSRITLTASGGPFRGRSRADLSDVTPDEALAHPTWDMGQRITVDSATLFNKGLEVVEAHHLFGVDYDRIEVVVHPQSVVHSMVEFVDGSWKGHLGHADMRIPIQYALTAPHRADGLADPFDFTGLSLTFEEPDRKTFPALDIAYAAGRAGGSAPAVMNAADEVAVDAFLNGRLSFLGIAELVEKTIDSVEWRPLTSFEDVVDVDAEARVVAAQLI